MVAANTNLIIEQGATFDKTYTWQNSSGLPINLTGYTARMQAKLNYDTEALINLTTENGGIVLGGSLGTIQLIISASATSAIPAPAKLLYDLELINGSVVTRLLQGYIEIIPEVTK